MNADTAATLQGAQLESAPHVDTAGNHLTRYTLTLGDRRVFQDVDQQGLPHDGSPSGDLHSDLCCRLIVAGHLDAYALDTL